MGFFSTEAGAVEWSERVAGEERPRERFGRGRGLTSARPLLLHRPCVVFLYRQLFALPYRNAVPRPGVQSIAQIRIFPSPRNML